MLNPAPTQTKLELVMQTYSSDLKKMRPLVDHELDAVSGGMNKIIFPLKLR